MYNRYLTYFYLHMSNATFQYQLTFEWFTFQDIPALFIFVFRLMTFNLQNKLEKRHSIKFVA